jgi:glutamyl-tRNA reductase
MNKNVNNSLSSFFVVGINYKKSDASSRGRFAVSQSEYQSILNQAKKEQVEGLFILSTCNRTELYGIASDVETLISLLISGKEKERTEFLRQSYIKSGLEAIEHLFKVTAGLDSQLLGDYEIVGQVRTAFKFAKENQAINTFLERLVNTVLQCSKKIRHQTKISSGTVSVSYAAVQYIKEHIEDYSSKNILLLGIGKLGRNTSRNIVDYLESNKVTLINRNPEKAANLSSELGVHYALIENLDEEIKTADIILVAANAASPLISCTQLSPAFGKKYIIDLSIPYNVESCVSALDHIKLVNVDELSQLKDKTLEKRIAEIPKASAFIGSYLQEFIDWYEKRKQAPVINAVKAKLQTIYADPSFLPALDQPVLISSDDDRIQRVINSMASKMKRDSQTGCYYIEAINEFINTGTSLS